MTEIAAHRDVEGASVEIARQIGPMRGHKLDLDAERDAERLRHVDVEARIGAVGGARRERRIIAGRADAQDAAGENVVEARLRGGGSSERDERGDEDGEEREGIGELWLAPRVRASGEKGAQDRGAGSASRHEGVSARTRRLDTGAAS